MKVTLSDGRIIDVKEPVEKHQIQFIELAEREKKDKDFSNKEIVEWRRTIVMELGGFTSDAMDSLPLIDKNKISDAIESRFMVYGKKNYELDF